MNEGDIRYQVLNEEAAQSAVYQWWSRLVGAENDSNDGPPPYSNGIRPVLRRAETPEEALLTDGFRLLWFTLPESLRKPWHMPAWGCVAAVLAEVREPDHEKNFAAAMGAQVERTGRPRVSELRFQQLYQSRNLEEFQRRMRRAVHLLGKKAHVLSLADGILQWQQEKNGHPDYRPDRRLPVRWALAYFSELAKYQKSSTAS